jgi:hypothetical protein
VGERIGWKNGERWEKNEDEGDKEKRRRREREMDGERRDRERREREKKMLRRAASSIWLYAILRK